MTCLRVVMNRPERWSRSAGQQGAESCTITLYAGLSTCGVCMCPPPNLTSTPPLGPDQSINASQAAVLLLRSPSASLHSAYSRLAGLISKLHPVPRLQAAAACEPSVEPDSAPAGSVCLMDRHLPIRTDDTSLWSAEGSTLSSGNGSALMKRPRQRFKWGRYLVFSPERSL